MINVSFTRDTDMRASSPQLFPFRHARGLRDHGTAVVASIPAPVLLIVAQRYLAAGVTAGAVKD
jgi:hypothetical protein